ncbi:ribonuclease III domain-containing protein [Methanoregula sp.]|uniref:ribonuclease III domain-containing protein n=1 Tax=Methanoregula sp. TaxID=2052170 RepID=UPI002C7B0865|nr:ribonuclease III domain-containing protein [Methanoregula sp.]HVP96749.1 ribonuclease III domain-containing protein [Methanoregula sp.]
MEDDAEWITYRDQICYPVEKYLLGYPVRDKERLISAIISNAFTNEPVDFEKQLKKIPMDESLETIGDFVLDFAIIENFPKKEHSTPKEINDLREFYSNNQTLQRFSKNCIHLQNFILWGSDQRTNQIWNQPTTEILADRFEMLIAVIYLERGIEGVKEFLKKHNFFDEIDKIKNI